MKMNSLFLAIILILSFSSIASAQEGKYKALGEHILKQSNAPDATRIITEHLEGSAVEDPIEELVRWASADFPELRDEKGYWTTDSQSLRLCVVSAIHYLFSMDAGPERARKYLDVLERLKKDSTIDHHLTGSAFKILNEKELKDEFMRLVASADAEERARALNLGRTLAERDRDIFEVYSKKVRNDTDAQVRNVGFYSLAPIRGDFAREVTALALERLAVEKDGNVREIASRIVKQGVNVTQGWNKGDIGGLLLRLVAVEDPFVRKVIAITVAQLTTDNKALHVLDDKFDDQLIGEFLNRVRAARNKEGDRFDEAQLVELWTQWWTPLIPKITVEMKLSH